MPNRIIRGRRTVSRRTGIGVIVLTSVSVVMLAAIVWMFSGLNERQRVVLESVREDAVWAAYQTEREAGKFVLALVEEQGEDRWAALTHRFDLLYSRAALLSAGTYAVVFREGELGQISSHLTELVDRMALIVDAKDVGGTAELEADAAEFQAAAGDLIMAANAAGAARRLTERTELLATYWRIGLGVAALTIALVLIVILLGLQLIHSSRTGREIELLSRRNARVAKKANAASEAKSAFLATMSHEIRTPLNGILGIADLLQDTALSPDQHRQVDIIRQSGNMLLDVINDILDFSKLESGAVRFEPAPVTLGETLDVVTVMMRPRAEAAGLGLEVNYSDYLINADANRLRQVLVNLVGNAIKFTETGSVAVNATIEGETLRIAVTDTGPGIASDAIPRLFKDFSQLDSSSSRSFGGTGLGLAICKRLVNLMGGKIGVVSKPGEGSTFWFEVPVGPAAQLLPRATRPLAPAPTSFSGRVLVVDDNATNRDVCSRLLQRLGVDAITAADGTDALTLVAAEHFDLILMDMQMPKLDGLSASRMLRERGVRAPIVGLTANAYQSDRDACLAAGMDEHLAKPITRQKLSDLLRRYLADGTAPVLHADFVIDAEQQRNLADEIGEDILNELMTAFELDMQDMLYQAAEASQSADTVQLDRVLHTIKGAAQTLGLTSIAQAAELARAQPANDLSLAPLTQQLAALQANSQVGRKIS